MFILPIVPEFISETILSTDYLSGLNNGVAGIIFI
jgi:hypothetical protein